MVTEDGFVVGADTRVVDQYLRTIPEVYIKVMQLDSIFVAYCGLSSTADRFVQIPVALAKCRQPSDQLEDTLARFRVILRGQLTKYYESALKADPNLKKTLQERKLPPVEVLFFGYEGAVKKAVLLQVFTRWSQDGGYSFEEKITRNDCSHGQVICMGNADTIQAAHASLNRMMEVRGERRPSPQEMVRGMVEAAIQVDPVTVGPPILILQVQENGARWLAPVPGVPELLPY